MCTQSRSVKDALQMFKPGLDVCREEFIKAAVAFCLDLIIAKVAFRCFLSAASWLRRKTPLLHEGFSLYEHSTVSPERFTVWLRSTAAIWAVAGNKWNLSKKIRYLICFLDMLSRFRLPYVYSFFLVLSLAVLGTDLPRVSIFTIRALNAMIRIRVLIRRVCSQRYTDLDSYRFSYLVREQRWLIDGTNH